MTFALEFSSRKTARKALGGLLHDALEGGLAQAVYDHAPADFATSPVVCVRSAPSNRGPLGIGNTGSTSTRFALEILVYVRAGSEETGWKPAEAQDAFDDLEAAVAQIVARNRVNAAWQSLRVVDRPTEIIHATSSETGGMVYDIEIITVEAQLYDQ